MCSIYCGRSGGENPKIAEQLNAKVVLYLVNALEKVSGKLVHISTDYVFDGNHSRPYKESDPVSPISVYGKTKEQGNWQLLIVVLTLL